MDIILAQSVLDSRLKNGIYHDGERFVNRYKMPLDVEHVIALYWSVANDEYSSAVADIKTESLCAKYGLNWLAFASKIKPVAVESFVATVSELEKQLISKIIESLSKQWMVLTGIGKEDLIIKQNDENFIEDMLNLTLTPTCFVEKQSEPHEEVNIYAARLKDGRVELLCGIDYEPDRLWLQAFSENSILKISLDQLAIIADYMP